MPLTQISSLPAEVRQVLAQETEIEINRQLRDQFGLSRRQFDFMLDTVLDVLVDNIKVINLPDAMAKMPSAESVDLRSLCLAIALKKLWPLQDYLKEVDVLIKRLGGIVPEHLALPGQEITRQTEESIRGTARDVLRRYKPYNDLYLTQKPMANERGRLQAPTVANWLDDYLHVMGASDTSSLKRSQYMVKSRNVAGLNNAEKENLLNFLTSYDEDIQMYWRVAEGQYMLVSREQTTGAEAAEQAPVKKLSDFIEYYTNLQNKYRSLFEEKKKGIAIEIDNQIQRLPDIIWDSLAQGETERCLAAIDFLLDRHSLSGTLEQDQRYKGIVRRSIDVRFGTEAKNVWTGSMDSSVSLAVFWRLILVDKLKLEEGVAAILTDYFTKRLGKKTSPVYLDLQAGSFKFREIKYENRALDFA